MIVVPRIKWRDSFARPPRLRRRRRVVLPLHVERAGVLAGEVGDDRRAGAADVGGDLVGRRGRLTLVLQREGLEPKLVGRVGIWKEGERKEGNEDRGGRV